MRSIKKLHQCPKCDRIVKGPGFFRHVRVCYVQTDIVNAMQHAPVQRYTVSNGRLYDSTGKMTAVL